MKQLVLTVSDVAPIPLANLHPRALVGLQTQAGDKYILSASADGATFIRDDGAYWNSDLSRHRLLMRTLSTVGNTLYVFKTLKEMAEWLLKA